MNQERQVLVRRGSLTDGHEAVLVNATNTNLHLGYGVSKAIHRVCGEKFQDYIRQELYKQYRGPMPPGSILITHAGDHPNSQYVAHVAVMDYRHGMNATSHPDSMVIQNCYQNLWTALEGLSTETPLSVAVVALGAGVGQVNVRVSTELACETALAHFADHPNSNIGDLVFYGFQQFEYIAMIEVVSKYFALPPNTVPEELRSYLFQN